MAEDQAARVSAELLGEWRAALLWVDAPAVALELRQGAPGSVEHFPSGREAVHFVTAWNPDAHQLLEADNARRQEALRTELDDAGIEHWRAAGYAPDLNWVEEGFALPNIATAACCAVGHRYGQLALYRWTREHIEIVDCQDGRVLAAERWSATARTTPPLPHR